MPKEHFGHFFKFQELTVNIKNKKTNKLFFFFLNLFAFVFNLLPLT